MAKEGFDPLYSNIVSTFCSFLGRKNPFEEYQQIKAKRVQEEGAEKVVSSSKDIVAGDDEISVTNLHDLLSAGRLIEREQLSFGELFGHKKYPDLVFALTDTSEISSDGESETWVCCWNKEGSHDRDISEALDFFVTAVLKIGGCDKSVEEIMSSDTFSLSHQRILEKLGEYNLKQASLEEKKTLFELISDPKTRDILIEFNKKNNILLSDFVSNMSPDDGDAAERRLNFLSGQGLLDKSLVVICKKTNQWWNMTIPSLNMLKELEKAGATCTSCGAKITDEKVDSLFRISQTGSKLVSGSYWMMGKIVEILRKSGLREKDIFVSIGYDGEEIDILALAFSKSVVFELKDREFGLGDAYKFHGKVSRLKEKTGEDVFPIVITTKIVAAEARKLLSEVASNKRYDYAELGGSDYLFVEGLENVEPEIRKLFDDIIVKTILNRTEAVISRFPAKTLVEMGFPQARS
jgi:hypothetical protein